MKNTEQLVKGYTISIKKNCICIFFLTPLTNLNTKTKVIVRNFLDILCVTENPLLENIRDACMLMGTANYSVSRMGLDSPQNGGCVHFNHKKPGGGLAKTFTLWLDNLYHGGRQCGQEGTYNKSLI